MLDLATEVSGASAPAPDDTPAPLGRAHARGLREIYRSAGWPGQDMPEIELLTGGMLQRVACEMVRAGQSDACGWVE